MVERRAVANSAEAGTVLYTEAGASWWPVLWGPGFAGLGVTVEGLTRTRGPVHGSQWLLLAGAFAVLAAVWVYGRRRWYSVRLTSASLVVGRAVVPVSRIAAVPGVGTPRGAKVLGGDWTVPRGTREVPLRLYGDSSCGASPHGERSCNEGGEDEAGENGRVVLAWARHPEALTQALRSLVDREIPA
ncbi:hypothetical protein [Haloactinomyces albus]|uniref:Uncharacterized protein n=1 Tax=Haloactinomyces albus TaxID=1352928 RepID=A0AAE4CQ70_9ACTN|nr:hypothetical protein [Haloactinomyces albus]MDR7302368.1 hypothetical protein [Haloactinomyces albus]